MKNISEICGIKDLEKLITSRSQKVNDKEGKQLYIVRVQ
jgi:hypothetical protein